MATEVKFCGLTRPEDAAAAAALGADYVGVIFAGGPRRITPAAAAAVLAGASRPDRGPRRVGVFGSQDTSEIAAVADALELDVVQLHGDESPEGALRVRAAFAGTVWGVVRLTGATLPAHLAAMAEAADALVLDARVEGSLGGTGVSLPWAELAEVLAPWRERLSIVLAGGLRPENVEEAIGALRPSVVDVSSGVESAPGIKDHQRMRAFRDAVRRAGGSA